MGHDIDDAGGRADEAGRATSVTADTRDDHEVLVTAGLAPSHERPVRVGVKRAFDLVFALTALVLLLPVYVGIAAAVALTSPGPIFFGHTRVGRDGAPFTCWKFRTMQVDAEERLQALLAADEDARAQWEESFKLVDDPRITPLGGYLRRSSLDELPQFWNVLRGEMSIVGPRPVVPDELAYYGEDASAYLAVRPGLTGPWQAFGRTNLSYDDRVLLDRHYADEFDLLLDIGIIVRTVGAVARRIGAH